MRIETKGGTYFDSQNAELAHIETLFRIDTNNR